MLIYLLPSILETTFLCFAKWGPYSQGNDNILRILSFMSRKPRWSTSKMCGYLSDTLHRRLNSPVSPHTVTSVTVAWNRPA